MRVVYIGLVAHLYIQARDLDMNKLTPILKLLNQSKLHLKYTRTSIFYLHQNYSSSLKSNNQLVEKHLDLLKQYNFHKPSMETMLGKVMYENFDDIIEKYNYIRHTMGLKPKELLNSRVLCSDLNFIKTRHTFLDRSGQFQYKTKDIPEEQLQNPTLNSIFDTTDRMFAEKIAKMSVKEYETFSSYYAQELAEEDGESDLES
ncbi:hypothetical protein M8J77_007013 [Diaphorina citri]|nr:hypothetical protein M8J77_007013 [Diaphorina citri]